MKKIKKKLAYVDFWSHKYTKSGDFLRKILSEEFEIIDFWWKPRMKIPIDRLNKFEHIFQIQSEICSNKITKNVHQK